MLIHNSQVPRWPSKSMDSCKQIYKYLTKQNNQVVDLITRGKTLHSAQNAIFSTINQYVMCRFRVGEYSRKELSIIVQSAENANKLRFQSEKILTAIKNLESFESLEQLKIKVVPEEFTSWNNETHNIKKHTHHSQTGSKNLEILSESISDPALKASLKRLASRLKN